MSRLITINEDGTIEEGQEEDPVEVPDQFKSLPTGDFTRIVSTGSTLLDLAVSGTRVRGGGIPAGIMCMIYGPSGHGKTTLLCEIGSCAQEKGGFFLLADAERRIDKNYRERMGLNIDEKNYRQPRTIADVKDYILKTPASNGLLDVTGIDSIAALLSELDTTEDGDKRGQARAKELHDLCRKTADEMSKEHRLIVFTNQIQDAESTQPFGPKEKVPGGNAPRFWSSLIIRIGPAPTSKITEKIKFAGKDVSQEIGVISRCKITKSTVDVPYRTADIYIVFNYGIDDIRANLTFCRRYGGERSYTLQGEKLGVSLDEAVESVERLKLEGALREKTIDLWEEIQKHFKPKRLPKRRGIY